MFWGILTTAALLTSIFVLLGGREYERDFGLCSLGLGLVSLVLGITILCLTSPIHVTAYQTNIPGVGILTKTTTNAPGFRGVVTFPFEEYDAYNLKTVKGTVTIDSDEAEKLMAAK